MTDTGGVALKVDFIVGAFSQMRISGLTVNPSPPDLETALDRLEDMAAEWFGRNISTGYNFEDEPDPNTVTNVNRQFWQAFKTNLAVRLIPDFNKTVPLELKQQASQSLSNLSARSAFNRINQVPYPSRQPIGSGNTLRYNRWNRFYSNQNEPPNSSSTYNLAIGETNDFVEHYDSYLNEGESISSFTIDSDQGLTVVSSSLSSPDVNYRLTGKSNSTQGVFQQVEIVITTDQDRVLPRFINFNVSSEEKAGT